MITIVLITNGRLFNVHKFFPVLYVCPYARGLCHFSLPEVNLFPQLCLQSLPCGVEENIGITQIHKYCEIAVVV